MMGACPMKEACATHPAHKADLAVVVVKLKSLVK